MDLNLPIVDRLRGCRSVLVAGMGGGYDVFCGLPLYLALRSRGFEVHLANYSFSDICRASHGIRLSPTQVGVLADHEGLYPYFPEYHLARWLHQQQGLDVPVWCWHKVGAQPLAEDIARLQRHLSLDAVVLVDGGVDSLIRGDEAELGTVVEDAITMHALTQVPGLSVRLMACIGLGAERDITHAQIFENIAGLTREGGFLGSCSLTAQMACGAAYIEAVLYAQAQRLSDPSVINSSIVSALRGEFGNWHLTTKTHGSSLWISPLMPMFWFFDFDAVARRNLFLPELAGTQSFREALGRVVEFTSRLPRRPGSRVPLW
jgi:hypothetical protein